MVWNTQKRWSRDKGRACRIFSVSFSVCLWEAFHLYNKSSLGRAVSWYEKGTKNEMMSDSHGKNRSYVKINLSVLQHLLHKPEQKKGKKKKKLVRRCFFSLKLSFVTISFIFVWHHRDDVVSKREVQEDFHSWVARPDSGKRMVLSSGRFNCFPDLDINLLHCLGKACTLFKPKLSPLWRGQGRHEWSVRPLSDHSLYFCFYVDSAPALCLTS